MAPDRPGAAGPQPAEEVPRRTETREAPGDPGARREESGTIRPTSNAGRPDASRVDTNGEDEVRSHHADDARRRVVECSGTASAGCNMFPPELAARARRLRLLLFDVDGVLTDGTILLDAEGRESKRFSIRDGTALVWARQAGLLTGVLSARTAAATAERARQLGMKIVRQQATDKAAAFAEILAEQGLVAEEVAYMGDDLMDLPVLRLAGVSAAPADAADAVRARVHFVSRQPGGAGAVREFIEGVLHAQDRWAAIEQRYLPAEAAEAGASSAKAGVEESK